MVGTRPTILFSARARRALSFIQATVRMISTGKSVSEFSPGSGARGDGTFAIEMHEVGEQRLGVELAQHRGDLAAMIGAVIDDVLERLPHGIGVDPEVHGFVLDDAIEVLLRE